MGRRCAQSRAKLQRGLDCRRSILTSSAGLLPLPRMDRASSWRTRATPSPPITFWRPRPTFIGGEVAGLTVFAIMPELNGISISVAQTIAGVDFCFDQPADVRRWLDETSRAGEFATS